MPKAKASKSRYLRFLPLFIVIIIIIGAGFLGKYLYGQNQIRKFKNQIIPEAVKKIVNNPSVEVTIENVKESNGIYQFDLKVGSQGNSQNYVSYITKDGKIVFTSGIKLDDLNKQTQATQTQNTQKKLTCNDLDKSDAPKLTAYVVSNCPYGLQMQRVISKALDEAPQILPFINVRYLGSVQNGKLVSMHGDKEAVENLKQICIREEQKDKYWNYLSCYIKAGNTDQCLATSGVNTANLTSCTQDATRGLKYAQADFDLANKLSVGSSPTLVLNDKQTVSEFDFGGRVPNALKSIVCCSSNTKPGFCSSDISKDEVASSFSETTASTNTAGASANCAPAK